MSLQALFAVLASEAAERAEALRLALLRRRFALQWEAERARLWAIVERRMNFQRGLARDIREWRTEP